MPKHTLLSRPAMDLRRYRDRHAKAGPFLLIAVCRAGSGGVLGLFLLTAFGCGGGNMGTVSGSVKYEEGSVPVGTKVFFELPGTGYVAAARIDEQGAFQLTYQGARKVQVGDYSVFFGPPESNLSQAEFFALKKKVDAEFRKRGKRPPPSPDWVLPEKYYSPNTTTLSVSVVAGANEVELVLED